MIGLRQIWALAVLAGGALAQTPPLPVPPGAQQPVLPPGVQAGLDQAIAAALVARDAAYTLRPGDELDIRSLLIPELNQAVRVRPDGKISVLLLNEVEAAGKTAEALSKLLTEGYSEHFKQPQVTVAVRSFSPLNVYVGGEVVRPSLVPLGGGLTAAAAVIQAGGFKEEDGPRAVLLVRQNGSGGQNITRLDLTEVLVQGKPDIPLQPSDVIFVPRNAINVFVAGEVAEPGLVGLMRGLTAFSAVIRARGFRNTANLGSVMLLRNGPDGKATIQKLDLRRVATKGTGDVKLEPFDVVFVPKTKIAKINQFVDQYMRQVLPIGFNFGFNYILGGFVQ